jgi:hypothetical protein
MAIEPATDRAEIEDFKAHVHDYAEFTRLLKYGAIVALVTALFVMMLIS